MNRARFALIVAIFAATGTFVLKGARWHTLTARWADQGMMNQARRGACSVLLPDGRVLISGGFGTNGPLASAEVFDGSGSFAETAPMYSPRAGQVCAALPDGRVLVAGGTSSGGGVISSSEIYDLSSDSWSLAGPMMDPRSGATASRLPDGRILVAGGDTGTVTSATLEVFDPALGSFSAIPGALSSPRRNHSAATLKDGRVLIAGGNNGGAAMDSVDVYDPAAGRITQTLKMSSPRDGLSATRLLDGTVLFAGGNNGSADLASAELFDPKTSAFSAAAPMQSPRRDHLAFLLPDNNTVLLVGGTSAGAPLATSEQFVPWQNTFKSSDSLSTPRTAVTGTPLKTRGVLMVAGGKTPQSAATATTTSMGFATVTTDKPDYQPGDMVTITGAGFGPNEVVGITIVEDPDLDGDSPINFNVTSDASGGFTDSHFEINTADLNISFTLTATGQTSGLTVQMTFTDGTVTAAPILVRESTCTTGQTTFTLGATVCASITITTNGSGGANFEVQWLDPTNTLRHDTAFTSQNNDSTSTDTFTPAQPNAVGTWTIKTCKTASNCNGGNQLDSKTFTILAAPTKLAYTTTAFTGVVGQCSPTITVQTQNASGGVDPPSATTVNLSSNSIGGAFFSDSSCATPLAGPSLTIPITSSTASFFYRDGKAGSPTLTASATGLTSATQTETINKANTSTAVSTNAVTAVFGQSVQLSASVTVSSPGSGTPGGTVQFAYSPDGTSFTSIGSPQTVSSGSATLTTAGLPVGTTTVKATYSGDSDFNTSSGTTAETVNKASTTTAVTSSANPSVFGQSVTFTANISVTAPGSGTIPDGETVTFKDGATTLGTGTTSGGSATFATSSLMATHSITAVYAGDANFSTSTSSTLSQVVNKANTTTSVSTNAATAVFGQSVQLSASVAITAPGAGTLTGTVQFAYSSDGTNFTNIGAAQNVVSGSASLTTTGLPVGTTTVKAIYSGDANFNTSTSSTLSQVVNKADTTTAASTSVATAVFGQSVLLSASVAVTAPGAGTLTGTVQFAYSSDGTSFTNIGTPQTVSAGSASLTTTGLPVGITTVKAIYSGDSNFNGSSGTTPQTVNKANTTTTVSSNATTAVFGQSVQLTASVTVNSPGSGTPSGNVQFAYSSDGTNFTNIGTPQTVSAGSATLTTTGLPVGTTTVKATYAGDSNFNGSSGTTAETVNKANTSTAASTNAVTAVFGQSVQLSASVTVNSPGSGTPGGTVQFAYSSDGTNFTNIGTPQTVSSGSATLTTTGLPVGTTTIKATYAGDSNFIGSSGTTAQTVNKANTTTAVTSNPTGTYGQAATVTLSATVAANSPSTAVVNEGTVTFTIKNGSNTVGTATSGTVVGGAASASFSLSGIDAGTYSVQATYNPAVTAPNFNTSTAAAPGTLTVNKADAVINVTPYHVVYDAAPHTATATATGVGGVDLSARLTLTGTTHTNAGDYPADAWSFAGGTNYNDASGTVHDIIDKATATIYVTPYHVTYDAAAHTATGTAKGVGGVDLSASLTLSGTTHTSAGDYPADAWTFAGGTNYNDASGTVHDIIDKANATINVTPYHVTYNAAAHTATGTATGVGGVDLSPSLNLTGTTHTNAGDYTDTWTFAGGTNYNDASSTVHDIIDKANATINVTPYHVTYTATAHTATGTATGVAGVDLSASLNLAGTTHTNALDYLADAWSFAGGTNYNDASGTVHDIIDKANATISVTPYHIVYDATAHTAMGTAKGVMGETLGGLNLGGTTNTNAGDYPADPWTFTNANYNDASGTVHDVIDRANATVTVLPYNLTYDGYSHTASGTAKGVIGESLSGLGLSGTMHTNAGTYPNDPWTFTDVTGNYNNASGTVSDSIAKANPAIHVTPYSATYDGDPHTAAGTATGARGEALAGLDLNGTAHTAAGTYATDPWTFTDSTGNYNNASGTVSDSIAKANPTIHVMPYSVTYDAYPHTATGTATGAKGEALAGLDLSGTTHTAAGTYATDPWTFTDSTGNYNNASGTVSDSIAKANPTIYVTPYSVTYDTFPHTATGTATGVKSEILAGLVLSGTTHTGAGTYATDPWTFTDSTGNYNNASGTTSDSIAKANPTIHVTPYSVTYDTYPHTATGTAIGVTGEALSGLDFGGTTHTNAGSYATDLWTFTDITGNYNNTSGTTSDSIAKASATINVTLYHVVYDTFPHTATGTATGVKGETLTGLNLGGTTNTNAGDYAADPWTFTNANYNDASGTLHDIIDKATATISVTPYQVTYDTAAHTATGAATGVGGADLGASLNLSGTVHTTAGDYPSDGWTFTNANYNYASGTIHDIIDKATATIHVTPYSVPYDGAAHTATATATGVGGVDLSASVNLTATTHTSAGDYPTDAWTFTNPNYIYASGTVHDAIAKANATITVTPYNVTYDYAPHTAIGTAKGVGSEPLSGLSLSGTTHTNAGTYGTDPWTFTDVTGNYYNSSGTVSDSIAAAHTSTVLTSSPGASTYFPQPITFTATVGNTSTGAVPMGSVVFSDQFGFSASATLYSGVASITTGSIPGTALSPGSHLITATYMPASSPAVNFVGSINGPLAQSVTNVTPGVTITGPTTGLVAAVGTPITFTGSFTDTPGDTHTAKWTFSYVDPLGNIIPVSVSDTVTETATGGTVSTNYTFTSDGVYNVRLDVTDFNHATGTATTYTNTGMKEFVVIYDPSAGFVTGGGWINSPRGAMPASPFCSTCSALMGKASFGFNAQYHKGQSTPDGQTQFQFQTGNLDFHSTSYQWLVVSGPMAQYKGNGTINGSGGYTFILTARDGSLVGGNSPDGFRLKIMDSSGAVVYDNMLGASDANSSGNTQDLDGGSVVIHSK